MLENFKIVEMFKSFQGEGVNIGKPAVFIRLFGCNERCSFCDEPLHKDASNVIIAGSAREVADEITPFLREHAGSGELIIFTGGEPTLYHLPRLIAELNARAYEDDLQMFRFAVETNGSGRECIERLAPPTFVTISPKRIEHFAALNFRHIYKGEVKIPLWKGGENFFDSCLAILCEQDLTRVELWATPINDELAINGGSNAFAAEYVKEANKQWAQKLGKPVRLNIQAHKIWNVK